MHNIIIDGNNILYACLAMNKDDYTLYEEYIGGVTGFLKSLNKIVNTVDPKRIFVVFDIDKSDMRLHLYPEYKANRTGFSDGELSDRMDFKERHINILRDILPKLNCHVLAVEKVEGDDVIANYIKQTKHHTTIVSSDRDLIQLMNKNTSVYRHIGNQEFISLETIKDYLDYPYYWLKYIKILSGDASDNITSIKGLGEKRAIKILKEVNDEDLINDNKEAIKKQIYDFAYTEKYTYLKDLKLYMEEGLYDRNQKIIDLDYAPEINIREHIYKVKYDLKYVMNYFDEIGIIDFDYEFWLDNLRQIKN